MLVSMQRLHAESGEGDGAVDTSWAQLSLELLIFAGIAVLLLLTAERLPAGRVAGNFVFGIAVVLHGAGLVRLSLRAADHARQIAHR